jgi:hypothetical protein
MAPKGDSRRQTRATRAGGDPRADVLAIDSRRAILAAVIRLRAPRHGLAFVPRARDDAGGFAKMIAIVLRNVGSRLVVPRDKQDENSASIRVRIAVGL